MPDTLTITRDWFAMLESLPDVQSRWNVLYAVSRLAFDGVKPDDLNAMEKAVFMIMKTAIQERYRKRRYIAKKRHEPSTVDVYSRRCRIEGKPSTVDVYSRRSEMIEQSLFNIKEDQENTLKDITLNFKEEREKINGKETEEKKSTARRVFKVPSLDEVRNYISGKGYSVDAEEFYSFYESNGWHVGKNRMRDWRRAVSCWQCRINQRNKTRTQRRDYSGI